MKINDTLFFVSLFITVGGWKEVGSCFLAWQEKKENVYARPSPTHSLLLILYSPETSCFLWLCARVPETILGSSSNRWYNIREGGSLLSRINRSLWPRLSPPFWRHWVREKCSSCPHNHKQELKVQSLLYKTKCLLKFRVQTGVVAHDF